MHLQAKRSPSVLTLTNLANLQTPALQALRNRLSDPAEVYSVRAWVEDDDSDLNDVPQWIGKTEVIHRAVERLRDSINYEVFSMLLEETHDLLHALDDMQDEADIAYAEIIETGPPERLRTGSMGAPRYDIDETLLEQLYHDGLLYEDIAKEFNVSTMTICNRLKEMGLGRRNFADVDDETLVAAINEVYKSGSGDQGYRAVRVCLEQLGIHVREDHVRLACAGINPQAVLRRFRKATLRRRYRVPFVNSLWHFDGHHKLNPYKFVIHGCIDGFSRHIIYLEVANNNRAETVEGFFLDAVLNFGWPSRVRCDHGKENVRVRDQMYSVRGQVDSQGK